MVKIRVTRQDIKRGIPESDTCCPIALAIKRKVRHSVRVDFMREVNCPVPAFADISRDGRERRYALPNSALGFLQAFDSHEKVYPFTFEMEPVA
jgi:hypothetical protein